MLKHGTPEHRLAISATWSPAIPQFIRADKGKILQVLFNLVGNATKFTKAGSIRLEADRLETDADGHPLALPDAQMMIALRVKDTGCGIPDDFLPRLFEPFEQAGQHTRTSTGAGLGLTISRRIARAMGGDITAQSVEGQGSTFLFSFVAKPDDGEHPQTALPSAEPEPSLAESRCRVLIVDDDDDNRKMLSTMLTRAGFVTALAASGQQALDALTKHAPINVVLMDACMPGMDGIEAIRRIRERPGMADLPILLVTGLSEGDEASTAEAAQANGCVFKPFKREQLLQEIQRVIEQDRTGDVPSAHTGTQEAQQPPACIPHEAFRSLPAALASAFELAVSCGDITTLRSTLPAVKNLNPLLADHLSPLIAAYDYDALRRLLDPNPGDPA
jgi:CheY-like chemotaxis protein